MSHSRSGIRPQSTSRAPWPPESVTARAIDRLLRWPMQRGIKGTAWFPALDLTDDFYGVELREEVMALGSNGWLTLVQAAAP